MEVPTMYNTSSIFSVSYFRNGVFVWLLVVIFSSSFVPSATFAQQATAIINTLNGTVLVNGQEQGKGFVLTQEISLKHKLAQASS